MAIVLLVEQSIYLLKKDEPVWLDRDDTLEVIDWTIKYIKNINDDVISKTKVLSEYYNSIIGIENFINKKLLIKQKKKNKINLNFIMDYDIYNQNYLVRY